MRFFSASISSYWKGRMIFDEQQIYILQTSFWDDARELSVKDYHFFQRHITCTLHELGTAGPQLAWGKTRHLPRLTLRDWFFWRNTLWTLFKNAENCVSERLDFNIFLGDMPPDLLPTPTSDFSPTASADLPSSMQSRTRTLYKICSSWKTIWHH